MKHYYNLPWSGKKAEIESIETKTFSELLKYAYDNYPVGTKYLCVSKGILCTSGYNCSHSDKHIFNIIHGYDITGLKHAVYITDGHGGGVYRHGKWAKILNNE